MADKRIWNFNPGPATMPVAVLEKAKNEMLNYAGTGMSVMELSHRSKAYEAIQNDARALLAELLGIPSNYKVLFLQGGASFQFAMIPMNLLPAGKSADYILSGYWAQKAFKEAKTMGTVRVAGTTESVNFNRIPEPNEIQLDADAAYVHVTSNNTIFGTQWKSFPKTGNVPLIGDMSSDILSRKFDVSQFGMVYAGAQKNLGPAGVVVAVVREDLVNAGRADIPAIMKYSTHVENDSLYNTPPTYTIYLVKLVLEWVKGLGGLAAVEKRNEEKGKLLYGTIDGQEGFFKGTADPKSRSLMNVTFRLPSEELEAKFIAEAQAAGFGGLKGHRSVGGIRVSMYNALEPEGIKALTDFMKEFAKKNG
jgi:phosphoserine aminotransferase